MYTADFRNLDSNMGKARFLLSHGVLTRKAANL